MSENLKNPQAAKSARRRPDKIWDTACLRHASGVSLSRTQFVFLGFARGVLIKTQYCSEAGETKTPTQLPDGKNRRYRSLRDLDGGVFVPSAWRIPSPHPFLPPCRAGEHEGKMVIK